jgi:predicted TPR repeat methyltransferase
MMHKGGKWYADWRDGNSRSGKRHRKAFNTKRLAAAYEQRMKNAEAKKATRPTPRPTT